MSKIEDFPEVKVERFGKIFLDVIIPFCQENGLKMDNLPEIDLAEAAVSLLLWNSGKMSSQPDSKAWSFDTQNSQEYRILMH